MISPDAPIADRTNAVFLGASVRSGTAKVLAVKTGRRTDSGRLQRGLGLARPRPTLRAACGSSATCSSA